MNGIDLLIVQSINGWYVGFIHQALLTLSSLPVVVLLITSSVLLPLILDRKKGLVASAAILLGLLFDQIITTGLFKNLIPAIWTYRARPYLAFPDLITPAGPLATDTSFPSGHTSSLATALFVLIIFYPRLWPLAILIPLMGISRIHLGMHYPSDVLAGIALGLVYAVIATKIIRAVWSRREYIF